ncbi:MAG: aldehyde ferredoxin oxidoreductase family protein, partial [Candidatus Hodarchaeota archaeon]
EPNIDALDPKNKLIFAVGPFTGTSVPCTSRMAVAGKSPLTNAFGAALTGGYFPVELKFAGYDALIIEGKAQRPSYIWIKDGSAHFRDASKVWGMKTFDCQHLIKNEVNDQNARICCIGPAGENLSKMACVINEWRAAGRKGLGAVMGAKNLKAIAVRGTGSVSVASQRAFKIAKKAMTRVMKESPVLFSVFSKTGTSGTFAATSQLGIFPAKNWSATGEFVPFDRIGLSAQDRIKLGNSHCYGCPVACSQLLLCREGSYAGILSEGPEYETQYAFGGQTGVDNLESIVAADRLCDELGLDTISAGVAIGFAMELFEKGILTESETNGIKLTFGNHEAMLTLLQMIAFRNGVGALLADGVKSAAEKIGKGSEKYSMHVKGLELPAYDVRGAKAQGLNYATAYTGADHNRGYACQEIFGSSIPSPVDRFCTEGKGWLTKWNQDMQTATTDCPTVCAFPILMAFLDTGTRIVGDLMEAITGVSYTPEDILKVGERVNNLARAFNAREGFGRKDDNLPERLMQEAIPDGPSRGHCISREELNLMLDEYYAARGWDFATGLPSREKLIELNLEYAADQLLL